MGTLRFPGVPLKFDGARPDISLPPRLGEHTRAVLAEAGLAPDEIDALLATSEAVRTPEGAGA